MIGDFCLHNVSSSIGFSFFVSIVSSLISISDCSGAFDDVKKSLSLLIKSNIHFECRTTCDPRLLTVTDLFELGTFLKEMGVKEYYLQKYRPIESDKTTSDMDCESLINDEKLISFLTESFEKFDIRR